MKSLIVITKNCPSFTNLNFSPHLPPPPNLLIYQSSTRAHCLPKIPVQNQALPTCCGPKFRAGAVYDIFPLISFMGLGSLRSGLRLD